MATTVTKPTAPEFRITKKVYWSRYRFFVWREEKKDRQFNGNAVHLHGRLDGQNEQLQDHGDILKVEARPQQPEPLVAPKHIHQNVQQSRQGVLCGEPGRGHRPTRLAALPPARHARRDAGDGRQQRRSEHRERLEAVPVGARAAAEQESPRALSLGLALPVRVRSDVRLQAVPPLARQQRHLAQVRQEQQQHVGAVSAPRAGSASPASRRT